MQQPIPATSEDPDEALDELSLLRHRITVLEQALVDTRQVARHDKDLRAPYFTGTGYFTVPASIGTAFYPEDGTELGELIEIADTAMYGEKVRKRTGSWDVSEQ